MDLQRDGYIATITGAPDVPFDELAALLDSLTDGYECRAVVLPLEGRGSATPPTSADLLWLERYAIPLVAGIVGDVSGAATGLALGCDIRVAAPGAVIGVGRMGTRRTLRLLGQETSVAVMEKGGKVDAAAALDRGIVSVVTPAPLEEAKRIAGVIASRGPIATRFGKEAIWRGLEMPLPQALRFETDLTILLQSTKDRAEGVSAFVEKRAPTFTGD